MTTTKEQAKAAQEKLVAQHPEFSFGLGKDGENWTVEVRDTKNLTVKLPTSVDGVQVRFREGGVIQGPRPIL